MARFEFAAIGTSWQIDTPEAFSPEKESAILARIRERIDIFDKAYSRFRKDSLVTEISRTAGTYELPSDALPMMRVYRDLYLRTGGLVTPLIGKIISDAGYDAEYSLIQKKPLEAAPLWDDVLEYSHPTLVAKQPVLLDFGAAGKGYLVDIVSGVLEECGIHEYCIDAGGDILGKGSRPVRIGLENPEDATEAIGICNLQNASLCGSSGNRRAWGNFTHIIDPKKLSSPRDILAVWTVAKTALIADALATALFFVPAQSLFDGYDFEYVIIRSDRRAEKSPGFPGELFLSDPARSNASS